MPKIIKNGVTYIGTSDNAAAVSYDNTASGLTATNVQAAIDEINTTTSPLFYYKNYTCTQASVAADANITMSRSDFSISYPSGYVPIAVRRVDVSKVGFVITGFSAAGLNAVLSVKNNTSAAIANTTFTIEIIYIKSNFLQNLT